MARNSVFPEGVVNEKNCDYGIRSIPFPLLKVL